MTRFGDASRAVDIYSRMPKAKNDGTKPVCVECGKFTAQRAMMQYVCEEGHTRPVHYSCRAFFPRCRHCTSKVVGTGVVGHLDPVRDRRRFKAYHVSNLHNRCLSYDAIGERLVKQGIAEQGLMRRQGYPSIGGITKEQREAAEQKATAEATAEWKCESHRIKEWFAEKKKE